MAVSHDSARRASDATVTHPGSGVAVTVPTTGSVSPAAPAMRSHLGRYVIEGLLGAGGMAAVYLARDPVLGREVALKVLTVDDRELGAARLVREAQALARVSHPNVIQVYEVGRQADGGVFIAMERIAGVTLATWLEAPRARGDILAVFVAAARGLAAAHAAGLVHRDFKPENVMVGDDGRVCVLDFGIARDDLGGDRDRGPDAPGEHTRSSGRPGGTGARTATGSVSGTPPYMSPEQWRGERADAASDQFSFCVALWRALSGEHPFELRSREALRAAVLAGQSRPPPRALPRRLRAVLRRGIAADPAARFASMQALIAALAATRIQRRSPPAPGELAAHAPLRRRWAVAIPALGLLAIGLAAIGRGVLVARPATDEPTPIASPPTTAYSAPVAITSRGDIARGEVSPDGTQVALTTPDQVIVQPLAPGAEPRVVLRGRPAPSTLSWSPDGRQLALVATIEGHAAPPGLVVIELATGAARRIGDNLGAIALLGQGELVAAPFYTKELAFYALAEPTTPVRRCPLPGRVTGVRDLRYDATHDALYVRLDAGDRRSSIVRLDRACRRIDFVARDLPILSYAVRPADQRVIARLMYSHQLVEIAGDGHATLGHHVIQSNQYVPLAIRDDGAIVHADRAVRWALVALDAAGARRELAGGAGESRFSVTTDGHVTQIDGLYERGLLKIGRLDALPGGLTTIAHEATRAVWSPDRRRIAVLLQTATGYALATWDAATRALSPLRPLDVPYDVELAWLDDHRVAYPASTARTALAWLDVTTGATGQLAGPGAAMHSIVGANQTRALAFVTATAHDVTAWTMREGEPARVRAVVPLHGQRPRVTWTADDRGLIVYDTGSGELWSVTGSGAPTRLPASDATRGPGLVHVGEVTALVDRLLITSVAASSDIYLSAPLSPRAPLPPDTH